jgi:hypothetical protein
VEKGRVKLGKGGEFDGIGVWRESVTKLPVGSYVVDTRTGRSGVVMGHEGPYVQLRPHGGGREWDAAPEAVREATPAERPEITAVFRSADEGRP